MRNSEREKGEVDRYRRRGQITQKKKRRRRRRRRRVRKRRRKWEGPDKALPPSILLLHLPSLPRAGPLCKKRPGLLLPPNLDPPRKEGGREGDGPRTYIQTFSLQQFIVVHR